MIIMPGQSCIFARKVATALMQDSFAYKTCCRASLALARDTFVAANGAKEGGACLEPLQDQEVAEVRAGLNALGQGRHRRGVVSKVRLLQAPADAVGQGDDEDGRAAGAISVCLGVVLRSPNSTVIGRLCLWTALSARWQ